MLRIFSSSSSRIFISLEAMCASIVFFWIFAITVNLNKEKKNHGSPLFVAARKECGAYLAKSTIPGAGLGLFAGKNYKSGDVMIEGDIAVPIYELEWHNNDEGFFFLWNEYVWGSDLVMNGGNEEVEDSDDVEYASFGIGAAVNCHMNLLNTDTSYLEIDTAGLHRSKDAGAGAIANAHDRKTIATTWVPAGMELFHTYGDNYFLSREKLYGLIPLERDFRIADNLLKKFTTLQSELQIQQHSPQLIKDLYALMVDPGMQSRALNALPGSDAPLDIQKAMTDGVGKIERDRSIRDLDWLDENGKCVDNLRPGQSNIEGAGRGAFATRSLQKGDVVAPAPLIHLNKNRLMMYDSQPNSHGNLVRNESAPYSYQLLLNYCFGHRNSKFLLSPYGPLTSLINHSSKNPNVRIEWASNSTFLHPEWKELSLKEIGKEEHAGLSFDYIAIRSIEEGDEILLDYGKEWEDAWNEHIRTWAPPKDAARYKAAHEMNNDYTSTLWPNHQSPYYPNNIRMTCRSAYLDMWGYQAKNDWETYHCRIVKQYTGTDGGDLYDVEIVDISDDSDATETTRVEVDGILFGVPRDIIVFDDVPYTRDHHMRDAFRHEMMIPDDMFPSHWYTP